MCSRYTLKSPPAIIAAAFELSVLPELFPRYNIAPTQAVPVVRALNGRRECVLLRWGLVPSWADDLKIGNRLLNARAETAATKPAFRAAFRKRRCLVVADGYYEWKTIAGKKQPFYYRLRNESVFAFAGLWERWQRDDQVLESCTMLTTDANALASAVHDRMPVILSRATRDVWLDPEIEDPQALAELLRPYPADEMRCDAVNPLVNNWRNDTPACVEPARGEEAKPPSARDDAFLWDSI